MDGGSGSDPDDRRPDASCPVSICELDGAPDGRAIDAGPPADASPSSPDAPQAAEVLEVCGAGAPYSTIGGAIAAASAGDTIEVCPGVYPERLTVEAKPLRIVGIGGAGATIIDAGGLGRALRVTQTGGAGLTLEGLTLRNGLTAGKGGGVLCLQSKLCLRDSVVRDSSAEEGGGLMASGCDLDLQATRWLGNEAEERGGAALIVGGSGALAGSEVSGNRAVRGGGLHVAGGDFSIQGTTLSANEAMLQGGGLFFSSDAQVSDSALTGNTSGWTGGGVYVQQRAPTFTNVEISHNTSVNDGAGMYWHQSHGVLEDSLILGNETGDDGGGVRIFEGTVRLERNRIEGNVAGDSGAGVRVSHVPSEFIDNVIVENEAGGWGGGMDLDNCSSIVRGGVIARNSAGAGGGIHAWMFPWLGGSIEDVRIADNEAWTGGGLFLQHNFQSIALRGLEVTGNSAGYGGGIFVRTTTFVISHSTFTGNVASVDGGALLVGGDGDLWEMACPCPATDATGSVDFVVAHGNSAGGDGAGLWAHSPSLSVGSSIFFNNQGVEVFVADPEAHGGPGAPPAWRYNDVFPASFSGMADPSGQHGNISQDPLFSDASSSDFALQAGSACIDAGDPDYVDLDGTRADMGNRGGLGSSP